MSTASMDFIYQGRWYISLPDAPVKLMLTSILSLSPVYAVRITSTPIILTISDTFTVLLWSHGMQHGNGSFESRSRIRHRQVRHRDLSCKRNEARHDDPK